MEMDATQERFEDHCKKIGGQFQPHTERVNGKVANNQLLCRVDNVILKTVSARNEPPFDAHLEVYANETAAERNMLPSREMQSDPVASAEIKDADKIWPGMYDGTLGLHNDDDDKIKLHGDDYRDRGY